jgi:hypothetical protein
MGNMTEHPIRLFTTYTGASTSKGPASFQMSTERIYRQVTRPTEVPFRHLVFKVLSCFLISEMHNPFISEHKFMFDTNSSHSNSFMLMCSNFET